MKSDRSGHAKINDLKIHQQKPEDTEERKLGWMTEIQVVADEHISSNIMHVPEHWEQPLHVSLCWHLGRRLQKSKSNRSAAREHEQRAQAGENCYRNMHTGLRSWDTRGAEGPGKWGSPPSHLWRVPQPRHPSAAQRDGGQAWRTKLHSSQMMW